MAEYLVRHGVDPDRIWMEAASQDTEENLANSRELLGAQEVSGRVAVVTNNFHAFRAALEMRDAKLPGYTIGSPTAGYFWPSATIRARVVPPWLTATASVTRESYQSRTRTCASA